ncbi:3-deoxy-manno-octulosonate cytidylyltransferase [Paracoccus aestuariivivens]|uniref:3-deoxy-manno-octulosonate cytidylyltransferase n=1 Tax=Paracoccus aestuariivivens TaxID=1820333 RepID=A0A6L6JBM7_9RHOB|nr:3-deoxy-manno-octulosonate cytidylyltransferase [Paracoccus aestuariivivens]MTH78037.1 3-deoxy-manno-octulosonate cytidylyltransferase [Paracoccus aestuariivivens]
MTENPANTVPPTADASSDEWRRLFAGYSNIVLVANSDDVDLAGLERTYPDDTLFIFFNKVYKVLDTQFRRPALLVSRSGMMGANIVHRREVPEVLKYFDRENFLGVLNIIIGNGERFSPAEAFLGVPVRHLDLEATIAPFYPQKKFPTTGFALCVWLTKLGHDGKIILAGFSSKRSERWKVFDVHDWTYEQVLLRLLARNGDIEILELPSENPFADIPKHFPQFTPFDVAVTANEVLSDRLSNLGTITDRLMSVTKVLRYLDSSFRNLRPKTRKQKFLAEQQKSRE